jgi:hypothetical protein
MPGEFGPGPDPEKLGPTGLSEQREREAGEGEPAPYYLVLPKLQERAEQKGVTLFEVMDAVKADWLESLPSEEESGDKDVSREALLKICKAVGVDLPTSNPELLSLAREYGINANAWQNNPSQFRLHLPVRGIYEPHLQPNYELFFKLFGERYTGKEEQIRQTLTRFDVSIRPINLSPPIVKSEAIENFLPKPGQRFIEDPFGVQLREHLVLDEEADRLIYLSTRKKNHGTYLAILRTVAYCTGGCASCYRGQQTRTLEKFRAKNPDGTEEDVRFVSPSEQIDRLVKRWNQEEDPPEDILFSGGEPMDIGVEEWQKIFESLKEAKHLKFLRICTGDLFLGEPFRLVDPKFLDILKKWHEDTGKPIKFATNLPHPKLITPEAVYAVMKLHKLGIGIEIQTQTPLEEGTLCFQREIERRIHALGKRENELTDDELIDAWAPSLARSFRLLRELCVKASMISDRPYKFIHDMQKSSSIVYNTILFSLLSEPHVGTTDSAVRPTSFALFTPHLPNLNLGFHSLQYLAEGEEGSDGVKYRIPHSVGEMAEYVEPYWPGINDNETRKRLVNIDFWRKLRERVIEIAKESKGA